MSDNLSRARLLFEELTGASAAQVLQDMPEQKPSVTEDQWFDCKSGLTIGKDMERAWSKALGAFANNEGGVVVWGLIAKHDPTTHVDAVCGTELVPDVFQFKTRLVELQRKANDPPISGVEIIAVPIRENECSGFVVCFIPESDFKPHRSEFASQRFFLRVGDSSEPCSVALLRLLFHPKAVARLRVEVRRVTRKLAGITTLQGSPDGQSDTKACFEISVRNIGMTSVSNVYLRIENKNNVVLELEDEDTRIPNLQLKKIKSLDSVR